MNDIDELDRLHAAATAGPRRMVFAVRAYDAWPSVSARLRAAEAEVARLRGALRAVIDEVATEDEAWGGSLEQRHRAALGES